MPRSASQRFDANGEDFNRDSRLQDSDEGDDPNDVEEDDNSSDDEELDVDDDPRFISAAMPEAGATAEHLRTLLYDSQVKYGELLALYRKVKADKSDLKLRVEALKAQSGPTKGKKKNVISSSLIKKHIEPIDTCGRKYGLLVHPFPTNNMFINIGPKRPDVNPNGPERYMSPEMEKLGFIAELFDAVTPGKTLHPLFEHAEFGSAFCYAANSVRSNSLTPLKSNLVSFIFPHLARHLSKTVMRNGQEATLLVSPSERGKDVELLRLLGHHPERKKEEDRYDQLPPLLYKDGNTDRVENLFLGHGLTDIACVALFGAGVLRTLSPTSNSSGVKWKITHATPGLIALSCILARYLISEDTALQPQGKQTRILYQRDFEAYKRMIIKSAHTPHMQRVVASFQRDVFVRLGRAKPNTVAPVDATETEPNAIELAMAQMENEVVITADAAPISTSSGQSLSYLSNPYIYDDGPALPPPTTPDRSSTSSPEPSRAQSVDLFDHDVPTPVSQGSSGLSHARPGSNRSIPSRAPAPISSGSRAPSGSRPIIARVTSGSQAARLEPPHAASPILQTDIGGIAQAAPKGKKVRGKKAVSRDDDMEPEPEVRRSSRRK
ncbi:hypothetical protein EUX98_g9669 [Antrodiella citrinella]|uniref:Uncharacterized protein n=1 Tax=Antrodiella citrinella TaxID=2447956 RepID=A0A4S4LNT2_9APHY|nr:hypothetical protein EUX98_g9669 [Antrodiella citrinella]